MKIIVDDAIPFIKDRFPDDVEVKYLLGNEISAEDVKDADALIVRTRTKCNEKLLKGSTVRLVATATIGTDHIDMPWCEANGITVKSSPGCNAPGVAQYVFASLFKTGFDPVNQKLGIIGYGNVGSIVADWATRMGIDTIINDPPREKKRLRDINYKSLEEVLKSCDAVTIHVPFTEGGAFPTYKLIGEKELNLMKPGAIIINSSRGGVVDEKLLINSLEKGKLKGVVDVWENEPDINQKLVELAAVATPHIAGYSAEGKMRATRMVLEAAGDFFDIPVNTDGLECIPEDGRDITRELIEDSYNPETDSVNLKKDPLLFEKIRNSYNYRHEPLFNSKP